MPELNAERVKSRAKELGADLVGIASAATLNAFPPDPRWPQTPERISPYCKSVIVLVQRIPAGAFRCKTNVPVQYIDMLVLRKMDKVAYRLAEAGRRPWLVKLYFDIVLMPARLGQIVGACIRIQIRPSGRVP